MKQVISIRLEQSTIDKLKKQAKKENRSVSNLVGVIIERTIKEPTFGKYTHIDVL